MLRRFDTRRHAALHARRGFTLLEIIVVVTIIALLATLVAPRLLGQVGKTKQKLAQSEVSSLYSQVNIWLLDNGYSTMPDDFELIMLTEGDDATIDPDDLVDPWDRDYVLIYPPEKNKDFDIVSYGADGEPGGDGENADIWN
ncbi:MAG: type II secretion system protein GspG [Planctomycetota bacterium]|jgi:general secretion pathway protein G